MAQDSADAPNTPIDPIKRGAELIAGEPSPALERRLKKDIFDSLCRIKPELKTHDFEQEVMTGRLFEQLSAPLQGIAIARVEGALAFYNRIGWCEAFLEEPLENCIAGEEFLTTLRKTYHARTLHDLAYVHPKHFVKIFTKTGAASTWEELKRHSSHLQPPTPRQG